MRDPGPVLELLRDAAARDRPAITLTYARVAELLGETPPESWWREQRAALLATGYAVSVDHERRWVTFARAPAEEPPAATSDENLAVDVRITFTATATDATAWVGGEPVPFDLSAETARSLRAAVDERRGQSGGSGI
ncbi:MAG TPA: hypothetical protein VF288_02560 [Mycobacteriales bacterium]